MPTLETTRTRWLDTQEKWYVLQRVLHCVTCLKECYVLTDIGTVRVWYKLDLSRAKKKKNSKRGESKEIQAKKETKYR